MKLKIISIAELILYVVSWIAYIVLDDVGNAAFFMAAAIYMHLVSQKDDA